MSYPGFGLSGSDSTSRSFSYRSMKPMDTTKLPSSRLLLTYIFDLPAAVTEPSSAVHDNAVKRAAILTGLLEPADVAARAVALRGLTLEAMHHSAFDPDFHLSEDRGVRYEFFYDPEAPMMGLRVVTSLGEDESKSIDGVLSSRIAFHAMEVLEGKAPTKDSPAAREGKVIGVNPCVQ